MLIGFTEEVWLKEEQEGEVDMWQTRSGRTLTRQGFECKMFEV